MNASAKRKPVPSIPSLAERAMVLFEELLDAPASERREILTWWRNALDAELDDLAEDRRPKGAITVGATGEREVVGGIPVGWIKMQFDARGHGNCPCRAMIEAMKE
jgi:hypothetical protein